MSWKTDRRTSRQSSTTFMIPSLVARGNEGLATDHLLLRLQRHLRANPWPAFELEISSTRIAAELQGAASA